jgi:formate dehydrogenase major subunit
LGKEAFSTITKKVLRFRYICFWSTMRDQIKGRLTQPLVREDGSHRPATWDEALERVVAAFSRSVAKSDPRDFGMFSCSKTTNELNYAAQKFVRSVMGSNNIDSCNRT